MDTKFISYRLLKKTLERTGNWKSFLEYVRARKKMINGIQRTDFLKTCLVTILSHGFWPFVSHQMVVLMMRRHIRLEKSMRSDTWPWNCEQKQRGIFLFLCSDVYQLATCFCHSLVSVFIISSLFWFSVLMIIKSKRVKLWCFLISNGYKIYLLPTFEEDIGTNGELEKLFGVCPCPEEDDQRHTENWFPEDMPCNDLIPRFLAFRVPSNGCFDDATTHTTREEYAQRHLTLKLWTEAARDFLVSMFWCISASNLFLSLFSVCIYNQFPFLIFSSDDDNKIETRQTLMFSNI